MTVTKFRAWDTFHNKWVKHFYITENGLIYNIEQPHMDLIGAVPIEKSGLIVMQSTGLKDRNGIEIFESDVVSWIDAYGILHFGVVEFTKGMFLVNGDEPITEEMEVIGNIYQHPDLVEE